LYCLYKKLNILIYVSGKRLEWLGRVWRSNGDILKNVMTEQETTTQQTKNQMEKLSGKGYETSRRKCNNRLGIGQEKSRGLLMAAQILNGPLSCLKKKLVIYYLNNLGKKNLFFLLL